jgi:hypothetical protein
VIFVEPRLDIARQERSAERLQFLSQLIAASEAAFPEIRIRVLDTITIVNAQASVLERVPTVDLFGGLAYHPALGRKALAFALAHELGHHVAEGPRQTCSGLLACDCAADLWAVTTGLDLLSVSKSGLKEALQELQAIAIGKRQRREHGSVFAPSRKCWALNWSQRVNRLTAEKIAPIKKCYLFNRL